MKRTWTAHGEFPGKKFNGRQKYKRLYHYTSFDKFLKIWDSKELWFGNMDNLNDILEQKTSVTSPNFYQCFIFSLYDEIIHNYKRISFTMDYDSYFWGCMSPMMWGQYGDRGNGVCIEFDFDLLNIPKDCFKGVIKYKKAFNPQISLDTEIQFEKEIYPFIKRNKTKIFFTKEYCWHSENEYRVVSNRFHHLDISHAINNIYLTNCNSLETRIVENLVDEFNKAASQNIGVKYIHYIYPNDEISLPVLSDTKTLRDQLYSPKNTFQAAFNDVVGQKWEEYKKDPRINLLVPLPKFKD